MRKDMETLGEAAARLLGRMDEQRKRPSGENPDYIREKMPEPRDDAAGPGSCRAHDSEGTHGFGMGNDLALVSSCLARQSGSVPGYSQVSSASPVDRILWGLGVNTVPNGRCFQRSGCRDFIGPAPGGQGSQCLGGSIVGDGAGERLIDREYYSKAIRFQFARFRGGFGMGGRGRLSGMLRDYSQPSANSGERGVAKDHAARATSRGFCGANDNHAAHPLTLVWPTRCLAASSERCALSIT